MSAKAKSYREAALLVVKFPLLVVAVLVVWVIRAAWLPVKGFCRGAADTWNLSLAEARLVLKTIVYGFTLRLTGRNRWDEDTKAMRDRFYHAEAKEAGK